MKSRLIPLLLVIALIFTGCSGNNKEAINDTPTTAPTAVPTVAPTPTETAKEIVPAEPFDADGRAIAMYGTPSIDGTIDDIWKAAGVIVPSITSSPNVKATGEFKVLWDDNALYCLFLVTDPELNKANMNTYEQDSVEVFLDELNDKASSYQTDDVHYRVNYENSPSTDAGDSNRFYTATAELKDDSGNVIGYLVETSLAWSSAPSNDTIMGFDLQINDAGSAGTRLGTVNIFDEQGNAWQNPTSMGELKLMGKTSDSTSKPTSYLLQAYIKYAEGLGPDNYVNGNLLAAAITEAKSILENVSATQKDYDDILAKMRDIVAKLDDGSGFVNVEQLPANEELTDPFTFFDGSKVASEEDWSKRAGEIAKLYQYYMYGVMPDPKNETISYKLNGNNMNIAVEKDGKAVNFDVAVSLPDQSKVKMPKGGYPVLIAFGWLTQTAYANDHGYAVILLNTELIASDNSSRGGVFYQLYPYGNSWKEQTGALMAWSWGVSKILDALEAGAATDLNINPANSIMTGVSRWGKAAAVAGAFDKRIKVTAPSCSGTGGMAAFRYKTEGKTYDYSTIGASNAYKMTANEPLGSLQSSSEKHWFNDNFLKFKDANALPFDQHLLAALCAEENRYLFITGSYLYEDWTNPPAMWLTYLAASDIYQYLGLEDNIAVHIHKEGHMVTDEDMVYLLDFCDYHFYGKKVKSNLEDLKTSLFLEPANYDPIFDKYLQ